MTDRRHESRRRKLASALRALRGAPVTVAELAERLGCAERTAYRVLQALPVARTGGNARTREVRYFLVPSR